MEKCKNCQAVLPDKPEGKLGRNQLFCNSYCGMLFRGEIKILDKPVACLWCNAVLDQRGAGNPKKFCSKQHSSAFYYLRKPKAIVLNKVCDWCSKSFETKIKAQRFCCADCSRAGNSLRSAELRHKTKLPKSLDFVCDDCGHLVLSDKRVTKGRYGRFCRVCALRRRRERYRQKHLRRQKVLNPLRISADVLIERDGNVCHLCNTEIDSSLARNSRFGATIDHVIPLSKGGLDVLDNLKLAHWICNIKKGNRVDA